MLDKIFGSYSDREIKRIKKKYINKINNLEDKMSSLSDEELRNKTNEFKEKLKNGETLDSLMVESFAVVREASKRVLGMRPYDVQLIGGIALHQGRIAEMKTGEGKTLVATLPAYLNSLSGKGVHIITVNDYLAKRDRNLLEPLYSFLGVTSGYIISSTPHFNRNEIYNRDVVYATNSQVGFDYLKDNMVFSKEEKIQRELNFCLIDEADSILIDEARTPLIISSASKKPNFLYNIADIFAQSLSEDEYKKDEKSKSIMLTEKGVEKAEIVFGIENYSDIKNGELRHHIIQALSANYGKIKDIDYIVKDREIVLIDEFTGRIADGRKLSNGLHQAIESKEGLKVTRETVTLASITYQSFFKEYNKISGMTGTALTEQQEFNETYNLDVVVIPTNKPIARKDKLDKLYMTEYAKNLAIVKDICKNYKKGRPVLVGTASIQKSEKLSELLNKEGIPHQVLNAKQHHLEADIVAKAGNKNMITISTNMAGRGTDIKLGEGVAELGGLKVIGTERADNRRIDNQLIGRSGRQGDPGVSQFYTSFEDDVIVFATEQFKDLIGSGDKTDLRPVKNKFMDKIIGKCQKNIEGSHFEMRKSLLKYDEVINKQRVLIYEERNKVLNLDNLRGQINHIVEEFVDKFVDKHLLNVTDIKDINLFLKESVNYIDLTEEISSKLTLDNDMDLDDIKKYILTKIKNRIYEKEKIYPEQFDKFLKQALLYNIDAKWRVQVEKLDSLKKEVNLLSYKQEDPLNAYISKAFDMFQDMVYELQSDTIKMIIES